MHKLHTRFIKILSVFLPVRTIAKLVDFPLFVVNNTQPTHSAISRQTNDTVMSTGTKGAQ